MKIVSAVVALFSLVAVLIASNASAAGPDVEHGKTVFARCVACHDLNTGAARLGPSMKGIVGRKAGSVPNFAYSPALKNSKLVWNAATLDAFLTSPMKYVPGTRMPFAGLPSAQDRADLIAYLAKAAR
ncbi:cytochrome c family protein [Novosphingobium sp. Chol11]|uniref:c-type cytochrome n=1 Tax=Novosphingobium sp. Chol11 TaxID=1385763 RepID=UPI002600DD89|nr:cytochrome c family protein [Novosphingobium sp. Chol11]